MKKKISRRTIMILAAVLLIIQLPVPFPWNHIDPSEITKTRYHATYPTFTIGSPILTLSKDHTCCYHESPVSSDLNIGTGSLYGDILKVNIEYIPSYFRVYDGEIYYIGLFSIMITELCLPNEKSLT